MRKRKEEREINIYTYLISNQIKIHFKILKFILNSILHLIVQSFNAQKGNIQILMSLNNDNK